MIQLNTLYMALAVICVVNLILVTICTIISIYALVGVLALKNSTHTMVPVPADELFKGSYPDAEVGEDFYKKESEELQKEMPEFFETDSKGKKRLIF